MDPNTNLDELRMLSQSVLAAEADDPGKRDARLVRFAELVEALDGWIMGGGFLPERWARKVDDLPGKVGACLGQFGSRCLDDDEDFAAVRDGVVEFVKGLP